MSQMGGTGIAALAPVFTASNRSGNGLTVRNVEYGAGADMTERGDRHDNERATFLFAFSIVGLISNCATLLLTLVVCRLRKPQNAFFIHQSVLDIIKTSYCIVFSQSLFDGHPPSNCAVLGASYIVFVTASAFNLLAITINEVYHFTNKIAGAVFKNKCCIFFGLAIIWFSSIIINLGVAFLPANPTFSRAVGYCTFMYGVTGNYLLHILWILLITVAIILTGAYLRRFWIDIRTNLNGPIGQLEMDEDSKPSGKALLHHRNIQNMVKIARKDFILLMVMSFTFIIFWYPLFMLTLIDFKFKADPVYYKTLTICSWCHSSLTPVFFLLYNFRFTARKHGECHSSKSTLTSPQSPRRPNTLNVTPAYGCDAHTASGPCRRSDVQLNNARGQSRESYIHSSSQGQRSLMVTDSKDEEETIPMIDSTDGSSSDRSPRYVRSSSSLTTTQSTHMIDYLLNKNLSPGFIQYMDGIQRRANRRRKRKANRETIRSVTVANYHELYKALEKVERRRNAEKRWDRIDCNRCEVADTSRLSVARLSTGCLLKPHIITRTTSDFYLGKLDWV